MSARDDGGPAFPANHFELVQGEHGMTLRDYFAAAALPVAQKILQEAFNRDLGDDWAWNDSEIEGLIEEAYRLADAMLKERAK